MTTLAYRDGVLASDSQITGNDYVWCHSPKIGKHKGVLFGAAGSAGSIQEWRDWVVGGCGDDIPEMADGCGYLISSYHTIRRADGKWFRVAQNFWAEGTGEPIATGALEAGATAEEAVRVAIRRDVYSGGDVQVVSL